MTCSKSQNSKLLTKLSLVTRYTAKEEPEKSRITEKEDRINYKDIDKSLKGLQLDEDSEEAIE